MSCRSVCCLVVMLVPLFLLVGGCAEPDPWVRLAQARDAHEIEPMHWVPGRPSFEDGKSHEGMLSFNVINKKSPMELPCLTIDLIYAKYEDGEMKTVSREPYEVNLTGIAETQGMLEHMVRLQLPEGATDVAVAAHVATAEELKTLCEAKVVDAAP